MQTTNHIELSVNEPLKFEDGVREGRTPGRKLSKDDITSASVLIRGCTTQSCCGGDEPRLPDVITMRRGF